MSKVSVIIPNYNCARWLETTIGSCLEQREYLKEIIVVDDQSTDNSLEVLRGLEARHPDLIRVYRNENKGGNNARNLGYSKSSGEYIQWLDADDVILPGKFKAQVEFMDANPGVDIVYSDWKVAIMDGEGKIVNEAFKKNKQRKDMVVALLEDRWSAPHAYLLRRPIAQKLHELVAWNPATRVGQDREYFTIAAILGSNFTYLPGLFAQYNKWSTKTISSVNDKYRNEDAWEMYQRFSELIEGSGTSRAHLYVNIIYTNKLLCAVSDDSFKPRLKNEQIRKIKVPYPNLYYLTNIFPWAMNMVRIYLLTIVLVIGRKT